MKTTVEKLAAEIFDRGQDGCEKLHGFKRYPWKMATDTNKAGCMSVARYILKHYKLKKPQPTAAQGEK